MKNTYQSLVIALLSTIILFTFIEIVIKSSPELNNLNNPASWALVGMFIFGTIQALVIVKLTE